MLDIQIWGMEIRVARNWLCQSNAIYRYIEPANVTLHVWVMLRNNNTILREWHFEVPIMALYH
jgi:hypothetical protein